MTLEGAWETPWDHPGGTFASRPQNPSQVQLFAHILGGVLDTIFVFFKFVFQVSFSKAFGPNFLDLGLISASILKLFSVIVEDAGSLEK